MPRGRAGAAAWAGIGLAVAAVVYLAVALTAGGQAPTVAAVEGVDIGGLSRAEAVARLEQQLGGRASADLTVTLGDTGRPRGLRNPNHQSCRLTGQPLRRRYA